LPGRQGRGQGGSEERVNPKSEARNPTARTGRAAGSSLPYLGFRFVSDFGLRISDFPGQRVYSPSPRPAPPPEAAMADRPTVLCVASYYKGDRFLVRCKQEGCRVLLLTSEKFLNEPWPRQAIDEVFALPHFQDRRLIVNAV